ncbi:uncharacterized protein LOC128547335 isoform X2 [Mercenaria mercenaria]|uniref:uncharacterized protein LOC128547335 isoform X2 n=1 Tax=Mercenaria mercenaria TaxID=6596 RepID=UPI00234F6631|nr:uncharacterized protein LOC128547335 isoform X2 [Mercenaria mercenaria]
MSGKDETHDVVQIACEAEKTTQVDLFVVHVDDDWTSNTLLPLLKENEITYLSLENDATPGKSTLCSFEEFLIKSEKVLFVLSEELCQNPSFPIQYMIESALQLPAKDLLTVTTTGFKTKLPNYLRGIRNVDIHNSDNLLPLVAEIKTRSIKFCKLVRHEGNLSNALFMRGLCLQVFCGDIYGLLIVAQEKYLQVDMNEFSKHLGIHSSLKTDEACKVCKILCHPKTKVGFIINTQSLTKTVSQDLIPLVSRLCKQVCDASLFRTNWGVLATVTGPFTQDQQVIVSHLFRSVSKEIKEETDKRALKVMPCFPEFSSLQERLCSFKHGWSEETLPKASAMAKSGFFFVGKPSRAQCYYCGVYITTWNKADDPTATHAKFGLCPYVKDLFHENIRIDDRKSSDTSPAEQCKTVSSRQLTFYNFELDNNTECDNEKLMKEVSKQFAEAGFFYIGVDRLVQCFSCSLVIFYSKSIKNPWIVHANLSSNCNFLKETKGVDYIQTINECKTLQAEEPTVVTFHLRKFDANKSCEDNTKCFGFGR